MKYLADHMADRVDCRHHQGASSDRPEDQDPLRCKDFGRPEETQAGDYAKGHQLRG